MKTSTVAKISLLASGLSVVGFGLALQNTPSAGHPGAGGQGFRGAAHSLGGTAWAGTPEPLLASQPVYSEGTPRLMTKSEAGTGTLLFETTERGKYLAAPTLGTDVSILVSGPVARTTLIQSFTNPTDQWVEGVYVFPLPEGAAVDSLRLKVGERLIEGTIKEKREAKQIYEAAKAAGQTAALTEQERPNIFTNSVANIGPGETVTLRLTYQETVEMETDGFSLRFPMVVGPRYAPPAETVQMVDLDSGGFATNVTDVARITPPVLHPGNGPINPVSLRVDLDAGFDVGELVSPSHVLDITEDADGGFNILLDGDVFADRDFVLEWSPENGPTPSAGLFTEAREGMDYHLLMLTPSQGMAPLGLPRDVTFILDVSGSMSGESLRQAKEGLNRALDSLKEGDRFNIIAFDDQTYPMWGGLRSASVRNVEKSRNWLTRMNGGGGTDMLPALQTALRQQQDDEGRLSQILFLTDGAIGNEDQLFKLIKDGRGEARVFTIGMGSAPNTHFMRRAAELGQGTHVHIGDISEAAARMEELTAKLERPAMTDIRLTWPEGVEAESFAVPDLYEGETLNLTAKAPTGVTGQLKVTGLRGDTPWEARLPLGKGASREGISKLWAREKINALEVEYLSNYPRQDEIDAEILETALEHSLVSRLTSLVAVDVTPRRPEGERLLSASMPTNLPKGWDFDKVFGPRNIDYTVPEGWGESLSPGRDPSLPAPERQEIDIPRGSTPALLHMLLGLLMLGLGGMARLVRRVRVA